MTPHRVLVTGATGFIGTEVCRQLAAAGHEVHGLRRAGGRAPHADAGVQRWHVHDGSDADAQRVMQEARPDVLVHLAAHVAGPAGDADVTRLVGGNVLVGSQWLAAAAAGGCRRVVTTGTYWEYLDGDDAVCLYAALKQAFARVVRYYCRAYDMRAITLALYDTYGPGDPRGKFLTLVIDAARAGRTLDASDGWQQIDLVHVDDVARAYVTAVVRVQTLAPGVHETFGVGSGQSRSLRDIAAVVERRLGRPVTVAWGTRPRGPRTFETPPALPPLPDWVPQVTLEAGVAELLSPTDD